MIMLTITYTCIRNSFLRAENCTYLLDTYEPASGCGTWLFWNEEAGVWAR